MAIEPVVGCGPAHPGLVDPEGMRLGPPYLLVTRSRDETHQKTKATPTAAYCDALALLDTCMEVTLTARRQDGREFVWCKLDRGGEAQFFIDWRPWSRSRLDIGHIE